MAGPRHLALVAAGALLLAAAPAHAVTAPRVAVTVTACTTGSASEYRSAIFSATVNRGPRARQVASRFRLLRTPRVAGGVGGSPSRAVNVALPSWNAWTRSKRGRSTLVVSRRVDGLTGPAVYAVDVESRWYDAKGRVIARRTTRSPACEQPDYAPDLSAAVSPRAAGLDVTIANSGRSESKPGMLAVFSGGLQVARAEVPAVAAGATVTIALELDSCAAPLVVTVKTTDAREISYANNELREVPCG